MATEQDKVLALTEQINARDDAVHVWKAVEAIDATLQKFRPEARALAILYTSRILASRWQEAKGAANEAINKAKGD